MTTQPETEALQGADSAFFEALLDRDVPALEEILADQFLIVDVASGSVHLRAGFLEAIGGGQVTFREIETFPDEAVIRLAGPGTGIVVGRTSMSFSGPEGAVIDVASRYTHVFQADGPHWRLLTAQGTPITGADSHDRAPRVS